MKRAADFRARARAALSGNWGEAVVTTLVASLLGANVLMSGTSSVSGVFSRNSESYQKMAEDLPPELMKYVMGVVVAISSVMAIIGIVRFVVGGFVSLGLIQYNMNLIDGAEGLFSDLFSKSSLLGKALWLRVRMGIFIFLWTLLLIIPGIIKYYSYSMSGFIMAENPEIDAKEAMTISIDMMKGNKWRLFCLGFSFIGWALLSLLTMGIGFLFLGPYVNASYASFYDDISREYSS